MASLPPPIGLRHLALNVRDVGRAESFYVGLLGFQVEWRPDPDNLYLRLDGDNLALHRWAPDESTLEDRRGFEEGRAQRLDHLGVLLRRPEDVDAWCEHLRAAGVPIVVPPRTHRDGARSFYCTDPDGNRVQLLYHPPISNPPAP